MHVSAKERIDRFICIIIVNYAFIIISATKVAVFSQSMEQSATKEVKNTANAILLTSFCHFYVEESTIIQEKLYFCTQK